MTTINAILVSIDVKRGNATSAIYHKFKEKYFILQCGWTSVYGKEVDITLSNFSYPPMSGADGWENVEAPDYKSTLEFFVAPFLVQEWETIDQNGTKKETPRIDLMRYSAHQYKTAYIVVFNIGIGVLTTRLLKDMEAEHTENEHEEPTTEPRIEHGDKEYESDKQETSSHDRDKQTKMTIKLQ
ncbi:trichome birefringence-like protein [Tanacetum coccineum]|uniref:Trichome birefringence-like protein n=1 Tax=Tanacetum coccineum TaxID=301880 RepID=A0ABQ4X657_9ASTR